MRGAFVFFCCVRGAFEMGVRTSRPRSNSRRGLVTDAAAGCFLDRVPFLRYDRRVRVSVRVVQEPFLPLQRVKVHPSICQLKFGVRLCQLSQTSRVVR